MPRENRKRGKKHKKSQGEEHHGFAEEETQIPRSGPSWIVPSSDLKETNSDAPFGFVEPDVKAYFKTVDQTLREWQEFSEADSLGELADTDPNEERRLFLVAALTETSGKEKRLATDPECSNVLERMAYSMDDFTKRVFMDRLVGSYIELAKHRFGSHVVQTLFDVATATTTREQRGIFPSLPETNDETGNLPSLTNLVVSASMELLPSTTELIMDPFASHVLRALLVLLCPSIASSTSDSATRRTSSVVRSKKSIAHKSKQGPLKSVLRTEAEPSTSPLAPDEFTSMSRKFVQKVRDDLSGNEVRALAADKNACPVLVILLEIEAHFDQSNQRDSLMDLVSVGLISACLNSPSTPLEPSDFLTTLLREPISSHLLETLISLAPSPAFHLLWSQYFEGKLSRLTSHPVANFVVARAVERISAAELLAGVEEMKDSWPKIIKSGRTGAIRALVDRAASLNSGEKDVVDAILSGFGLIDPESRKLLFQCVLILLPFEDYIAAKKLQDERKDDEIVSQANSRRQHGKHVHAKPSTEPSTQGAVLLQSMLRLKEPHYLPVVESIEALLPNELLSVCHHTTSSRVIDALLDSPTVASRVKRKFILSLIGNFHLLVDDRIGSRVGDRCWAWADPYLKEKIARSLIPQEQFLAASFYGKFFARNLHLHLLKRQPEEWKAMQSKASSTAKVNATDETRSHKQSEEQSNVKPDASDVKRKEGKRKRGSKPTDEIDALFTEKLGKRQKKGSLKPIDPAVTPPPSERTGEKQPGSKDTTANLATVLAAIQAAPKE